MSHPTSPVQFTHYHVTMYDLVLVHSICLKCGASRLLFSSDGSLEEWEKRHKCKNIAPRQEVG